MIVESDGNLLEAGADALVNTVNTVGIMGKGIALQFKQAHPANFKAYARACKAGQVHLGKMFVFDNGRVEQPHFIVNFPTKKHWRSRARLDDIRTGLEDLVRLVADLEIRSIAVPPLGCGNGGLNWRDVEPLILEAFRDLGDVDVLVYPPAGAPVESAMPVGSQRPAMTPGKAVLVALTAAHVEAAGTFMGVSQLELQKLMYFQQAAGEDLRLKYVRGRYGPYAENLNHVLARVEGHFLRGYGDRSRKVHESGALEVLPDAADEANAFLAGRADTTDRIGEVLNLVRGFESPYELELLSSVHWVATQDDHRAVEEVGCAVQGVQGWSRRRGRLFTEYHLAVAWNHLRELDVDWMARSAV